MGRDADEPDFFDIELQMQQNAGRLALARRLGWLNCWTPISAEGFYCLSLDKRDERLVMQVLLKLARGETGRGWIAPQFEGNALGGDDDSLLPEAWLAEAPRNGELVFTYFVYPDQCKPGLRQQCCLGTLHSDIFASQSET